MGAVITQLTYVWYPTLVQSGKAAQFNLIFRALMNDHKRRSAAANKMPSIGRGRLSEMPLIDPNSGAGSLECPRMSSWPSVAVSRFVFP